MIRSEPKFGLILLAGASLIACGQKSESDALANDPFAASTARMEDKFGKEFGKAYRADPNSEPANVSDDDVVPVSYTTEPVTIE